MKNIIFIPYIKREKDLTGKSSIGHSNRHQGYEYGINSWKAWAKKNGHEVYIMSDLLCPESQMLITWQRWQVLNILEHNEIDYDQVLVVDADSISNNLNLSSKKSSIIFNWKRPIENSFFF